MSFLRLHPPRSFGPAWAAVLAVAVLALVPAGAGAQKKKPKKPKGPWWEAAQPRFAETDLGRVFSQTVDLRGSGYPTVFKPLVVGVGDLVAGPRATVIFDTELLRMAAATPDRPMMFNTYRNGLGGAGNWVGPPYLFRSEARPGWAREGSFEDPREKRAGPLPREHAHYLGNYRYGERVVIAYTVGGVRVLESPWVEVDGGGGTVISRSFEIEPSEEEMSLSLCSLPGGDPVPGGAGPARADFGAIGRDGAVTAAAAVGGAAVEIRTRGRDELLLVVPPHRGVARFRVLVGSGDGGAGFPDDFRSWAAGQPGDEPLGEWTRGGPAQWPETLITQGTLGKGAGPYVVDTVHPPFENPYQALFFIGGHDFFAGGDAAVATIHGDVWRVSGLDRELRRVTWKRFATGLFQPLGLKVIDDVVYTLGRDQITRLHDLDGDGEADFYENFNNGCLIGKNVHEYATGLDTDPEGNFYYVKGVGNPHGHAGTLLRVSPDGRELSVFATGFRWPNGSGVGPDGTVTAADQQGGWVPSSRLDIVRRGGFYGHMPAHHREVAPETYDGPLTWIPHKVDNSCGGQAWVQGDRWGLPEGQMLHLSYGRCRLFAVLRETVGGVDQGGVVRFGPGFKSGAMRARFNPADGQLYVSGLKGWQTSAAEDGCFQRVRYTGGPVLLPAGLNIHRDGIRVTFRQKLDRGLAEDLSSWSLKRWNYRWAKAYGSKDYSVADPEKTGRDDVAIASARLLPDGVSVFLEIADLVPAMQMQLGYDLETAVGDEVIGDLYHTVHLLGEAFGGGGGGGAGGS